MAETRSSTALRESDHGELGSNGSGGRGQTRRLESLDPCSGFSQARGRRRTRRSAAPRWRTRSILESLSTAWHGGEVRPTHRSEPAPRREWRAKTHPLTPGHVVAWLECEPNRTAYELLARLHAEQRESYTPTLLVRSNGVRMWRRAAAMRLVFSVELGTGVWLTDTAMN